MGLLTDPSVEGGWLGNKLLAHHKVLSTLLYLAGTAWFLTLAHNSMNHGQWRIESVYSVWTLCHTELYLVRISSHTEHIFGLFYFICNTWILKLTNVSYNTILTFYYFTGTYFSENALLPGLVQGEFMGESKASRYLQVINLLID